MTISGTVQLAGRIRYAPPVPTSDWSANPSWLSDVLEVMACSGRKEEEYTLAADGDTAVNLGSLSGANLVVVKVMPTVGIPPSPGFPNGVPAAPNPVVVKLTSTAGAAQALVVDGLLFLLSAGTPYTAMTVARSAGVQTVVRVLLFAAGS
jgi:hypothetical protein